MAYTIAELVADLSGEQALAKLSKVKGTAVPRGTYGNDNAKRCAKKRN